METIIIELVSRVGIPVALSLIKNLHGTTTIEQAIAALEKTKTAQEYVDADAKNRGIQAVPLQA